MNWKLKCRLYKAFSAIPLGERLYNSVQANITKSTLPSKNRIVGKLSMALDYRERLSTVISEENFRDMLHIDFGAGWQPTIPLAFYSLGMNRQRLLDIAPIMKPHVVAETIRIYREIAPDIAAGRGVSWRRLPESAWSISHGAVDETLPPLGIEYCAPYDESALSEAGLVTSTQVLLHLERDALKYWFAKITDALQPGGLFMATIHLKPLYRGLEQSRDDIDHLRYSPEEWARFGSRIMSYNRLKAPDYQQLLQDAGLALRVFDVTPGAPEDLTRLRRGKIHECFSGYSPEDLVARHLLFIAQKPV